MPTKHTPLTVLEDWKTVLGEKVELGDESAGRDLWPVTAEDGARFFLKRLGPWRNLPLADEARILTHLARQGIRVAEFLPTDRATLYAGEVEESFVLIPRLASDHFDAAELVTLEEKIGGALVVRPASPMYDSASCRRCPVPTFLALRPLTSEEQVAIRRLARSRTDPARVVERARIVWEAHRGARVPAIARTLGLCEATVRLWLKRFDARGVVGLADAPRAGRPPTYTPEEVGAVIEASLTKPEELGLPFGSWTLDRLTAYLHEAKGLAIGRSRIGELLQAEGLRWRSEETWFGERVDPAFAEKRGPSSPSTRRRLRVVS